MIGIYIGYNTDAFIHSVLIRGKILGVVAVCRRLVKRQAHTRVGEYTGPQMTCERPKD